MFVKGTEKWPDSGMKIDGDDGQQGWADHRAFGLICSTRSHLSMQDTRGPTLFLGLAHDPTRTLKKP